MTPDEIPPPPKIYPPAMGFAPTPQSRYEPKKRDRSWIWVILAVVVVVGVGLARLAYFAYESVTDAQNEANRLIVGLHDQMAHHDSETIYASSTSAFQKATTSEKNQALFTAIDRKLGAPLSTSQVNTNINANTSGTFLQATFETKFAKDASATEAVVWQKVDGVYKLQNYRINSSDLIDR